MTRRLALFATSTILALSLAFPSAAANRPEDFPLRVQIVHRDEQHHSHGGSFDFSHGVGQADLFEHGEPIGFDFSYSVCPEPLNISAGGETLNARWKKKDAELTVLLPVLGKPGNFKTCDWKIAKRTFVYIRDHGNLRNITPEEMKRWMERHDFDPENGKNELKSRKHQKHDDSNE